MTFEHTEALLLDERGELTIVELTECSGLTAVEVRELIDLGALVPTGQAGEEPTFPAACIAAVRTAARLRRDFEVDTRGLALALTLLERIEALEAELRSLSARLPHRPRLTP
ncbi:MAG TPA: chaperone modulator CbpM [Burkholderiales bacterium]|nr:chaperone modulator CbpM [Burkholderiales bacterium]